MWLPPHNGWINTTPVTGREFSRRLDGGSTVIHALKNGLEADAIIFSTRFLDVLDSMMEVGEVETGFPPLIVQSPRSGDSPVRSASR
ncbi:MAG: hypothetical protein CM15mP125_1580 [Gammaproteobacteria bacterium]|nr:MAG: hypothetical protein CM15mP125_1580 [Gammaproteobacteria bacterium]